MAAAAVCARPPPAPAAEPADPAEYYDERCAAVGCRPNPALRGILQQGGLVNVRMLSLRETYIGDAGAFSLAQTLWLLPNLSILDLVGNGLSNAAILPLCQGCARLSGLRALELSDNRLITRKGGQHLLDMMASKEPLLWIGTDATMVSQYFSSRLVAHGERRRSKMLQTARVRWEHLIQQLRPHRRGDACPVQSILVHLREAESAEQITAHTPRPPAGPSPGSRGPSAMPSATSTPSASGPGSAARPAGPSEESEVSLVGSLSSSLGFALTPRPPPPGTAPPPASRHSASLRGGGAGGLSRADSLSLSDDSPPGSPLREPGFLGPEDLQKARAERPLSSPTPRPPSPPPPAAGSAAAAAASINAPQPSRSPARSPAPTDISAPSTTAAPALNITATAVTTEASPAAYLGNMLPTPGTEGRTPPITPNVPATHVVLPPGAQVIPACSAYGGSAAVTTPNCPIFPGVQLRGSPHSSSCPDPVVPTLLPSIPPVPSRMGGPRGLTVQPKFVQNREHDEEWGVEPASPSEERRVVLPASVREEPRTKRKLYSTSVSFETILGCGRGRYCVTMDEERKRIIFGFATPTAHSHLLGTVTPEVSELFELIDSYSPKVIEIDTPFKFPGRIDYVPAVGGPDAFLQPPPPAPLPPVQRPPGEAPVAEPSASELLMFWSFVTTSNPQLAAAHSRRLSVTDAPPPVNPNDNTDESLRMLQSEIYHANIAPPAGYATALQQVGRTEDQRPVAAEKPPRDKVPNGLFRVEDGRCIGRFGGCFDHCEAAATAAARRRERSAHNTSDVEGPLHASRVSGSIAEWHDAPEPGATWGVILAADGRRAAVYPGTLSSELYEEHRAQRSVRRRTTEPLLLANGDAVSFLIVPCCRPPHDWQALDVRRATSVPTKPTDIPHMTREERLGWRVERFLQTKGVQINTVLPIARPCPLRPESPGLQPNTTPASFNLHHIIRPTPGGLSARAARLTSGALNYKGTRLATGSYDLTAKVWNANSGALLHTLHGHSGYVYDVIWNAPFCDRLVTASFDRTCKVWDAVTGQCLHTLQGHDLEVVCVSVNRQSTLIASGSMDETLIVWNALSGAQVSLLVGHTAEIVCVDFAPCGKRVVSGSADETMRVWHALTGECLAVMTGHTGEVAAVKFNAHGNLLLSCSSDHTCRIWDPTTRRCKVLKGHSKEVSDCEFSADGWLVASASEDMSARVWDTLTGGCTAMMIGHQAGVCCVSFCANGTELLTGSADMTCRRWKVDTGVCLQVLTGHRGVVISSYCEDGNVVLTISKDNTCRVWRRDPPNHSLLHYVGRYLKKNPELRAELTKDPRLPVGLRRRVECIDVRQTPPPTPRPSSASDINKVGAVFTPPAHPPLLPPTHQNWSPPSSASQEQQMLSMSALADQVGSDPDADPDADPPSDGENGAGV
eukprot:Hpha_TRINITY_DN15097_c2_g13::TRINITY_DN15097_c2_g13_i1::g.123462::m.123462/K19760/DAW1; dynein assembly factor with WDR repeat domains 1